ncbi:lysine-specific demethylase 7B-like isoform X2 [Branchiostoma lanceolatum]|uniref:lysine-specific demethylase 7B-like isoform X2 n=1 Tax=Branchiostoma lanceolatum TaxID=7740 RepID=UPI0034530598
MKHTNRVLKMASDPDEPLYCICRQPYDVTRFMIECDVCENWFHGSCVGVEEHQAADIDKYRCPNCARVHGPLVLKRRRGAWLRPDYSEIDSGSRAVQTGTVVFIKELRNRTFPSADEVLLRLAGHDLTVDYLERNGFSVPLLVPRKDGLGLVVPPATFSISNVEECVGSMREIDVIDVCRQEDHRMLMREWTEYYNSPNRCKVLNVISLEFSKTRLTELVRPPHVVRQISWVDNYFPDQLPEDCPYSRPYVSKYCLMGVKDSYTDFHVDFGGTSVWYHVLRGEKIFYLIRPTPTNLGLYERWASSSNQSEMFFGDQVDSCYKCVVKQGQTLFIPTGWIHAVLTPVDSLVFGGNFLHSYNIGKQLQVYDMEKRLKTPEKFLFPYFEATNWYAAKNIMENLKEYNEDLRVPPRYLLDGIHSLLTALRSWTSRKEFVKSHKAEVPEVVHHTKLIKDLARELKTAEVGGTAYNTLNAKPAKSEKKKKSKEKPSKGKSKKVKATPSQEANLDLLEQFTQNKLQEISHTKDAMPSLKVRIPKAGAFIPPATSTPATAPNTNITTDGKGLKLVLSNGKIVSGESGHRQQSRVGEFQPLVMKDDSSDEETLVISDEPLSASSGKLRLKLSFNGRTNVRDAAPGNLSSPDRGFMSSDSSVASPLHQRLIPGGQLQMSGRQQQPAPAPHRTVGTIEDLLQASQYSEVPDITPGQLQVDFPDIQEELKNTPASPAMQDAVQAMLSMALPVNVSPPAPVRKSSLLSKKSRKDQPSRSTESKEERAKKVYSFDEEDDDASVDPCYKDDQYVYPALQGSEDEAPVFKPRSKKPKRDPQDAPWNPKAKVMPSMPKPDRAPREGVRKPEVESALADAAAKLSEKKPAKRKYTKRKLSESLDDQPSQPSSLLSKSHSAINHPLMKSKLEGDALSESAPASVLGAAGKMAMESPKLKRPKKGMATAKQRLSKILKLNKGGRLII